MKTASRPQWLRTRERSNLPALRFMTWLSLAAGRPASRLVLHGIALYFTLFAAGARHASRTYLLRALGRPATWGDTYRHMLAFASTVHDRVYLLNGRDDLFDIEVHGSEALHETVKRQGGVLLMGAHLGSFEVLRAAGRNRADLHVAMLMYEENARKINAALQAINPQATQDVVALGRASSMIELQEKLDDGFLVGVLADRSLAQDATATHDLLGAPAPFPLGPWRLAALMRRPVFFMAGQYLGGNRYRLVFEPLVDFSDVPRSERLACADTAREAYVRRLEALCRETPYNWFNFFDFWKQA